MLFPRARLHGAKALVPTVRATRLGVPIGRRQVVSAQPPSPSVLRARSAPCTCLNPGKGASAGLAGMAGIGHRAPRRTRRWRLGWSGWLGPLSCRIQKCRDSGIHSGAVTRSGARAAGRRRESAGARGHRRGLAPGGAAGSDAEAGRRCRWRMSFENPLWQPASWLAAVASCMRRARCHSQRPATIRRSAVQWGDSAGDHAASWQADWTTTD